MRRNARIAVWWITGPLLCAPANPFGAVAARIKVTENRRYLQYENGKPFFYLGDTAWELFHRLNREEAMQYLTNRAQKGFTVIQAVVLAPLGGLTVPNRQVFHQRAEIRRADAHALVGGLRILAPCSLLLTVTRSQGRNVPLLQRRVGL